jgi:hypothetical protein
LEDIESNRKGISGGACTWLSLRSTQYPGPIPTEFARYPLGTHPTTGHCSYLDFPESKKYCLPSSYRKQLCFICDHRDHALVYFLQCGDDALPVDPGQCTDFGQSEFTAFYEIVFTSLISLVIIAAEILIFQIPVTGYTFLFIPAILVLIMLGMCFGLLLLPFAILYKDIQLALPAFLQIAMYATPVVYATTELSGGYKILSLNPVSPVLVSARDWLLGMQSTTGLLTLGAIGLVTIVILMAGFILQRIAMEILIERMGT